VPDGRVFGSVIAVAGASGHRSAESACFLQAVEDVRIGFGPYVDEAKTARRAIHPDAWIKPSGQPVAYQLSIRFLSLRILSGVAVARAPRFLNACKIGLA
jgi:hypothetical protein